MASKYFLSEAPSRKSSTAKGLGTKPKKKPTAKPSVPRGEDGELDDGEDLGSCTTTSSDESENAGDESDSLNEFVCDDDEIVYESSEQDDGDDDDDGGSKRVLPDEITDFEEDDSGDDGRRRRRRDLMDENLEEETSDRSNSSTSSSLQPRGTLKDMIKDQLRADEEASKSRVRQRAQMERQLAGLSTSPHDKISSNNGGERSHKKGGYVSQQEVAMALLRESRKKKSSNGGRLDISSSSSSASSSRFRQERHQQHSSGHSKKRPFPTDILHQRETDEYQRPTKKMSSFPAVCSHEQSLLTDQQQQKRLPTISMVVELSDSDKDSDNDDDILKPLVAKLLPKSKPTTISSSSSSTSKHQSPQSTQTGKKLPATASSRDSMVYRAKSSQEDSRAPNWDKEQSEVIQSILDTSPNAPNLFVTGVYGAGKTAAVKYARSLLIEANYEAGCREEQEKLLPFLQNGTYTALQYDTLLAQRCAIIRTVAERRYPMTALTAAAANLLPGGRTLHNFLGMGALNDESSKYPVPQKAIGDIAQAAIIFVDEISMLNPLSFLIMHKRLCELSKHWSPRSRDGTWTEDWSSKPFGGKRFVFMGDFSQLPFIVKKTDKWLTSNGGPYAIIPCVFQLKLWQNCNLRTFYLTTSYRQQSDPEYGALLARIRLQKNGEYEHADLGLLNTRVMTLEQFREEYHNSDLGRHADRRIMPTILAPRHVQVNEHNINQMAKIKTTSFFFPSVLFLCRRTWPELTSELRTLKHPSRGKYNCAVYDIGQESVVCNIENGLIGSNLDKIPPSFKKRLYDPVVEDSETARMCAENQAEMYGGGGGRNTTKKPKAELSTVAFYYDPGLILTQNILKETFNYVNTSSVGVELKVGAQVILTANIDVVNELYNGQSGIVVHICTPRQLVEIHKREREERKIKMLRLKHSTIDKKSESSPSTTNKSSSSSTAPNATYSNSMLFDDNWHMDDNEDNIVAMPGQDKSMIDDKSILALYGIDDIDMKEFASETESSVDPTKQFLDPERYGVWPVVKFGSGKTRMIKPRLERLEVPSLDRYNDHTKSPSALSMNGIMAGENDSSNTMDEDMRPVVIETNHTRNAVVMVLRLPLELAWAMTIHRCQGMTIMYVWIDMGNFINLPPALLAVALSRVQKKEQMAISRLHVNMFNNDERVIKYYKSLHELKCVSQYSIGDGDDDDAEITVFPPTKTLPPTLNDSGASILNKTATSSSHASHHQAQAPSTSNLNSSYPMTTNDSSLPIAMSATQNEASGMSDTYNQSNKNSSSSTRKKKPIVIIEDDDEAEEQQRTVHVNLF